MYDLSLITLFLVSIPEWILNIYLSFLITGYRLYLPFKDNPRQRKTNILKLLLATCIYVLIQKLDRMYLKDIGLIFIINIFSAIIILWIVYSDKTKIFASMSELTKRFTKKNFLIFFGNFMYSWTIPSLQVIIMYAFLVSVESIYIPPMLHILNMDIHNTLLSENGWIPICASQIDRFIQILLIVSLWNWQRLKMNFELYQINKHLYILYFIFIILIEFGYTYMYIKLFPLLNMVERVFLFIGCIIIILVNKDLYKLVTLPIDKVFNFMKGGNCEDEK